MKEAIEVHHDGPVEEPAGLPPPVAPAETAPAEAVPEAALGDSSTGITLVRQDTVWSPSQIVLLATGVFLVVFGLVAVIKGGLGGAINEPTAQVFGFAQTPLLGLIEVGAGIVFLAVGLIAGARTLGLLLGALLGIAGGLLLADLEWSRRYLTTDADFGWLLVGVGAAIVLILGLVPSVRSEKTIWS